MVRTQEVKLKLSDVKKVEDLPTPASGNKIYYDGDQLKSVKGFGCRVTAAGTRSFIFNYRTKLGTERRLTIGDALEWKVADARDYARELRKRVDVGEDPQGSINSGRAAPTVDDLCKDFDKHHIARKRETTARDYRANVRNHILPALKAKKVADVERTDIRALHAKVTKNAGPYQANRVHALLSKMFNYAIGEKLRSDNPCVGIERNEEIKRERYLTPAEIAKLTDALGAHEDQQAANIIRLLVLTGARRGEALAARWSQFNLEEGVWSKPPSSTKQKKAHRVPLSAPARQLIADLHKESGTGEFVFPAASKTGHRVEVKYNWQDVAKAAGLKDTRIHDLRHTYASILASAGMSLPIIGALLGHSQPATTARYAHLLDDPLRQATERVGAIFTAKKSAEVVHLHGK